MGLRAFGPAGCALLAIFLVLSSAGCAFPRDPMGTLEQVREGKMRVGVVANEPWTIVDGRPSGVEVVLAESFARELGARTVYVGGTTSGLLEATKQGEVDLLVGGFTDESPGIREQKEAGITRPYVIPRPVVGVPPGESMEDLSGRKIVVPEMGTTAAHLKEEGAVPVRVEEPQETNLPVAAYRWQVESWGLEPAGVELPEERHVMAVPPGENGWLVELEHFLDKNRAEAWQLLRGEAGP